MADSWNRMRDPVLSLASRPRLCSSRCVLVSAASTVPVSPTFAASSTANPAVPHPASSAALPVSSGSQSTIFWSTAGRTDRTDRAALRSPVRSRGERDRGHRRDRGRYRGRVIDRAGRLIPDGWTIGYLLPGRRGGLFGLEELLKCRKYGIVILLRGWATGGRGVRLRACVWR